jgi:hypothetical protein
VSAAWQLRPTEEFERRLKQFSKKHPRETQAMLDNLDTYLQTLQSGVKPLQVRHGFTHAETHGAVAIDQKGAAGKPTQTRLYVFPDPDANTLHLITIGDKRSQRDDNATCREFIVGVREEKQKAKEEETAAQDQQTGGGDDQESAPQPDDR